MSREMLIPFTDRMEQAVKDGRKIATSRTKRYGKPGDTLVTPKGEIILLTAVDRVPLALVRDVYWCDEGCDSPEDFVAVWNAIHPRKGFDGEQEVYLHHFTRAVSRRRDEA